MFVVFEGIDGAGKTTQARMLYDRLVAEGKPVELVADPGTTALGKSVRKILLENDAPITPAAQMLLFSAARAELAEYIRQRLANNFTVICDRWLLSTYVYQGTINGISSELIRTIFFGTANIVPDICVLLDMSPEAAMNRIGKPRDRYEQRSLEDRRQMRDAYLGYAELASAGKTLFRLNATRSLEDLHDTVYHLVSTLDYTPDPV